VQTRTRRRSIGAQRALGRRARSKADINATLMTLVERVARRLRTARRTCRTVVLRFRYSDFSRATRSYTIAEPTDRTQTILAVAAELLQLCEPTIERCGLTLLGVALTNLEDRGALQLTLPFDHAQELDEALDSIRERFGSGAITRGALVGRDPGPWVPLLPD
jgi:DNA polymerase-4